MKRYWIGLLVVGALVLGLWWRLGNNADDEVTDSKEGRKRTIFDRDQKPVGSAIVKKSKELDPADPKTATGVVEQEAEPELTEEEKIKAIDRDHMKKIHAGIFAYRDKHGHYPEYLSQLVPDFVEKETITSPKERSGIPEHTDPGLEKPYYGYEFSNLEFRDGRTFAEIKDIQRSEWGDVVPILRAFGFSDGTVMNMGYGGEIYETKLNWEWDPRTLDVVEKIGWGPGLEVGEFTEVSVKDADGKPVAGAEVWADGRTYSFDLPNRPFTTDENGIARVPLGADLDRTQLALRVAGDGVAAPAITFERGAPPESHEIVIGASTSIGGTVVNAEGEPVADTWVYLRNRATTVQADGVVLTGPGANLGVVKTDAAGNWQTNLHPDDTVGVTAVVATPDIRTPKYAESTEIDAEAAARGEAVIVVGEQ